MATVNSTVANAGSKPADAGPYPQARCSRPCSVRFFRLRCVHERGRWHAYVWPTSELSEGTN
jgi:hypothetical protein